MDQHNEVDQEMDLSASRACEATRKGAQAFARLLHLAEQRIRDRSCEWQASLPPLTTATRSSPIHSSWTASMRTAP